MVNWLLAEAEKAARIVANIMEATRKAGQVTLESEEGPTEVTIVEDMATGTRHHQLATAVGKSVI